MTSRFCRVNQSLISLSLIIIFTILIFSVNAFAKPMKISPDKINLQSKGSAEDIQAIIRISIQSGYRITDFNFTLKFNDTYICQAIDCFYCYIDDNLIISFNKNEIINNPATKEFANQMVVAEVNGYFRAESTDAFYDTWITDHATVHIMEPSALK